MMILLGVGIVTLAGLFMGSVVWPMKLMRKFQFEHWWFLAMLTALVIIPWTVTLYAFPNIFQVYADVPTSVLIRSNLFSISWGIANVLAGLCFVRIGVALTTAILTGIGVSVGVTVPMLFKGTGLFHASPSLISPAGLTILVGVGVMLIGVTFAALAGFGREKSRIQRAAGGFRGGLVMAVIAGITSAGMSFAFVYSQGPILARLSPDKTNIAAVFAVWAVGLLGGALVNILYPAYLMTKNKTWKILIENPREIFLACLVGLQMSTAIMLEGRGMLLLGIAGASIGFGIQQAMQIVGGQGLGFISGEWRGIVGAPRVRMYIAIVLLIIAAVIMACGNLFV